MPFMGIIPLVILGLLVWVVVLFIRWSSEGPAEMPPQRRSPGLDVLEERYARGEVSREEYLQKKADMAS
jgi:putative membrane protein